MGRNVGVVSFLERGEGSNVRNLCERNFLGALALAWEGALIKGPLGATPSPLPSEILMFRLMTFHLIPTNSVLSISKDFLLISIFHIVNPA